MSRPDHKSYDVELGPFFTGGVLVLVYGVLRRKGLAVVAGLAAIWVDQRSEVGRNLKRRAQEGLDSRAEVPAGDEG